MFGKDYHQSVMPHGSYDMDLSITITGVTTAVDLEFLPSSEQTCSSRHGPVYKRFIDSSSLDLMILEMLI